MSDPLDETIEREAAKPASLSSDAGSTTRRPLGELVEADRYLARKRAAAADGGLFGIRIKQAQHGPAG
jgi:hypothetical protein